MIGIGFLKIELQKSQIKKKSNLKSSGVLLNQIFIVKIKSPNVLKLQINPNRDEDNQITELAPNVK